MVGRRRTRVKRRTFHLSEIELDVSSDEDANVEVPQASTSMAKGKQKAVTKSPHVRITKKGKLGMIAEMPLDVLYEVSSSSLLSVLMQLVSCSLPTDILLPGSPRPHPDVMDQQGVPKRAHQSLHEEHMEGCSRVS